MEVLHVHLKVEASTGRAKAWSGVEVQGHLGVMQVFPFAWKDKGPDLECQ